MLIKATNNPVQGTETLQSGFLPSYLPSWSIAPLRICNGKREHEMIIYGNTQKK